MGLGVEDEDNQKPIEVSTSVKDTGTWAKSLEVTVPVETVDKEFASVAGELAGSINLPGFRPGKVPRNVVEKRFGDDIKKQVTANLLQRALRSAILKEKLEAIGEPAIEVEKYKAAKGASFVFNVDVEVKPTFELGQYKGLSVEQEEIEVLPDEIEKQLERIRERFGENVDAAPDHAVADHDTVKGVLRFVVEGKEIRKEEDCDLLVMSGHVIGAHAHLGSQYLEGAKVGEKRTVEESLSGDFPMEEFRGKKATLEFEIKSIKSRKLPALDDALAEKAGFKTAEALKDKVRSSLLDGIREQIQNRTRDSLMEKIMAATPFDLPKRLSDSMTDRMAHGKLEQLAQMGVSPEMLGDRMEEFHAKARETSLGEIRRHFILSAICEKEGIKVEDEEIDEEVVRLARTNGMKASEFYDRLVDSGQIEELKMQMQVRKALEYLVENADIKIVPRKPIEEPQHDHSAHAPKGDHGHEHGHEHGH